MPMPPQPNLISENHKLIPLPGDMTRMKVHSIHPAGARPRPSSATASPASASSNEHLCLAFDGPVLLSLLLPARVVDVVGSVL
ncbi:hypothetical protein J0S82_019785 [Galemys pyrenaicus]|uniref:Uncharacterized protein n=1 Tax=Galemys pyrenaicus TaxID=202257 RepID=A0A8J6DTU7_GALPY|nr:hypothetical protein J0S82_019785 [Galemys pyrenaicus]